MWKEYGSASENYKKAMLTECMRKIEQIFLWDICNKMEIGVDTI